MTAAPLPDGTLAGYRLVRRLGSGSRAHVYLGAGSTGSVALKVFNAETSAESVSAELEAIGRIESPHLVRLIDLSSSPDGVPIFVLERLSRGSVESLLAERTSIELGEAVTLLAPVATLVAELHNAGIAHRGIAPRVIRLGAEGQPVVLGLGHCALFEPDSTMAALDANAAAADDRDALARLALRVLERATNPASTPRTTDLIDWIGSAPRVYEFAAELAERLFECAEPLPVAVTPAIDRAPGVPARIPPTALAGADVISERASELPNLLPDWMPGWVPKLMTESPLELLRARATTAARSVRPRFWVVAGGVLVAFVLAICLIPSGGSHPVTVHPSARTPTESPATTTPIAVPDDPLLASKALLDQRATCYRDLSILCLDGVDEASSEAFTSDSTAIQQVQEGGQLPAQSLANGATLALVERLGDTALIGLGDGDAASILVVRTREGWRIRDYLSGQQATPTPAG